MPEDAASADAAAGQAADALLEVAALLHESLAATAEYARLPADQALPRRPDRISRQRHTPQVS
jgi:hypothetical protein